MQRRRLLSFGLLASLVILAGGWSFEDGMQPGSSNRSSFMVALGPKSALYQRILVEVDRITEVKITNGCGSQKGPPISCAGVYQPQGGSLPTSNSFRGLLHLHPTHMQELQPPIRRFLVHHELGHIVDFALVPDALDKEFLALFRRSPKWKSCYPQTGARDPCIPFMEIFADQFAYWSTPPGQPDPSVTYRLPRLALTADFQRVLAKSPLEDLRDPTIFDRRRG